jgi:DNA-binding CsgD family transcriptional regulator
MMSQSEIRISDSHLSDWVENSTPLDGESEFVRSPAARSPAMDEAGADIARQLNGPLTALLLYMGEIKQHSEQFAQASGDRAYLQKVVENALLQTERVCALVRQLAGTHEPSAAASCRNDQSDARAGGGKDRVRASSAMLASPAGRKPLTRREREVLMLISEGCSNKQGALRMQISPRTFESHRAEAMRKLGARNTADLVRAALLLAAD